MTAKSAQEIWETALGALQLQVSKPNFNTWLAKTAGLSFQDDQFVVSVPNTFIAEYLEKNQRSLIEKTLIGLTCPDVTVSFHVNGRREYSTKDFGNQGVELNFSRLNPRYTFDSFIVSNCNRMARAAAMEVADQPGRSYNPLFIYGDAGLGKTHLLQAIGHKVREEHGQVLYLSAEQFTNEFIRSLREKGTEEFRNRCRNVDVLLIDDIQFLCGKEQTEESFFHTFNDLHNANRQIAVTCNCPPKSIPLTEERLRSRFEWGLTTCIQPPDTQTRLAILNAKAQRDRVIIPPEVLNFIASRNQPNIRELEGSFNRVVAYARLLRAEISIELAVEALKDIASKQAECATASPSLIIDAVANCFDIKIADLKSRKRDKLTTLARQVAMYLLREGTSFSLEQIGQELGGREAITISQACKKIASAIEDDTSLREKILNLKSNISQATKAIK